LRYIYIDGYNILNSWPNLKPKNDTEFEGARQSLIEKMQNYGGYNGDNIFIIFDAHLVQGSLEKEEIVGNVTVVFTKEGETADSYIERTVNNLGRRKNVLVVTNDSLEQQLIFQRGAIRMSSLEFYHEVKNIEKTIKEQTKLLSYRKTDRIEDSLDEKILKKLEKMRRGC